MRLPLLLTVLISVAGPAYADGARESRYGPTTPRQSNAATARYDGPMLGWASKPQVSLPLASPTTPTRSAPLASGTASQATLAPVAYAPPPVSSAPALPTSLYAAPRPAPAATAPAAAPPVAKDWSSYRSTRMSGVAPPAAAVPASAPPPVQVAAAKVGGTAARFYSVDREYGLTPDAAPAAVPDNRVLITAAEPPPEPKDATPVHGSADWLAAGVAGDDDPNDDSASRRAKTRNEAL